MVTLLGFVQMEDRKDVVVKHAVSQVVQRGRIGRKRSFAIAVAVALMALPVTEALAFFAATGSGQITNVQAGTATSTITIAQNGALTYAGPSTTNLMPGGTVSFSLLLTCTAGCPTQVTTIHLSTWTSDKTGCDIATLPGSFTMPTLNVNASVNTGGAPAGPVTITWVNLAQDQSACSGAHFTFTLVTP